MEKIAKIISVILHPVLVAFWGFEMILFRMNPLFISDKAKILLSAIALGFMVIIPFAIIVLGYYMRVFPSLQFEKKEQRYLPVILSAFSFYIFYYFLSQYKLFTFLQLYTLTAILVMATALLISFFWKISLHSLAMGAITGMLIGLSFRFKMFLLPELILTILLSGLVVGSRLFLNVHNRAQTYIGFLVGSLGIITAFILF